MEKCWLVVRSLKNGKHEGGYKLSAGDILKLGRVKFRIKEIKNSGQENEGQEFSISSLCKTEMMGFEVDVELCPIIKKEEDGGYSSE